MSSKAFSYFYKYYGHVFFNSTPFPPSPKLFALKEILLLGKKKPKIFEMWNAEKVLI